MSVPPARAVYLVDLPTRDESNRDQQPCLDMASFHASRHIGTPFQMFSQNWSFTAMHVPFETLNYRHSGGRDRTLRFHRHQPDASTWPLKRAFISFRTFLPYVQRSLPIKKKYPVRLAIL